MHLSNFDFDLPQSQVALRPATPRDSARLLIVRPGGEPAIRDGVVRDLPEFLRPGDVMVFNNTKVIPAALEGLRLSRDEFGTSVPISLTLLESLPSNRWLALARPARRLRAGDTIHLHDSRGFSTLLVRAKDGEGKVEIEAENTSVEEIMARHGAPPLPPYIAKRRMADETDRSDYQTVYASAEGAVAAPTAGLHFTNELLERLQEWGIKFVFVTLHVGAGTFLPVKAEHIEDHALHSEWCEISDEAAETINAARDKGGSLVAVGTTSLRLLETAASEESRISPFRGRTSLFIRPGYRFKSADILLTNFHLPKSTLFMLVCAFAGTGLMKKAYAHAIATGYRFYSYGDACLLHRAR